MGIACLLLFCPAASNVTCSVVDGTTNSSSYPCLCGTATCQMEQLCNSATDTCDTLDCKMDDPTRRRAGIQCDHFWESGMCMEAASARRRSSGGFCGTRANRR